jgi:hypothetical protein
MSSLADRLRATLEDAVGRPWFQRRVAEDATTAEFIDGEILTDLALVGAFAGCTITSKWEMDKEKLLCNIFVVAVTENGETVGGMIKDGVVTITEEPHRGCFTDRQG